jgi:aspartyl-tRNA(Asn)/glutamyl-tRNA(Gln) amidotransferase subunit B
MGEVSRRLNASEMAIEQAPVSAAQLAALIGRISDNTISNNAARQVFDALWSSTSNDVTVAITGVGAVGSVGTVGAFGDIDAIIEAKGLKQMNDTGELEKIIDEVLTANPKNVEEFKAGNTKALNGLVGPIMKASKGKANPGQVNALLMKKLG